MSGRGRHVDHAHREDRLVAAIAAFATLAAFGNITEYGTNFAFVQHVLSMDSVFPDATITYRAITARRRTAPLTRSSSRRKRSP